MAETLAELIAELRETGRKPTDEELDWLQRYQYLRLLMEEHCPVLAARDEEQRDG